MKKNRMMRLASALLVLTLLTTSIICGTFAKYVSSASASDTARAAKWGVTVKASGNLFESKYLNATNNNVATTSSSNITVEGKNDTASAEVVAPGTTNPKEGFTFSITGTPEVSSKVSAIIEAKDIYLASGTYGVMQTVKVDDTTYASLVTSGLYTENSGTYTKLTNEAYSASATYYTLAYTATVGSDGYYPVKYTWNSDSSVTKATAIAETIAKKFKSNLSNADDADTTTAGVKYSVNKEFAPNIDLKDSTNGIALGDEKITWEWAFGSATAAADTGTAVAADSNDARDTILGDLMAGGAVVVGNTDGTYTTLKVADNLVKNGENEVGCLETTFNVKFTVQQID